MLVKRNWIQEIGNQPMACVKGRQSAFSPEIKIVLRLDLTGDIVIPIRARIEVDRLRPCVRYLKREALPDSPCQACLQATVARSEDGTDQHDVSESYVGSALGQVKRCICRSPVARSGRAGQARLTHIYPAGQMGPFSAY